MAQASRSGFVTSDSNQQRNTSSALLQLLTSSVIEKLLCGKGVSERPLSVNGAITTIVR